MRLVERLSRLERATGTDPFMTAAEIDAAAGRYQAELLEDGVPGGATVDAALASWRRIVAQAAEPWLQRVWAGMSPTDLYA